MEFLPSDTACVQCFQQMVLTAVNPVHDCRVIVHPLFWHGAVMKQKQRLENFFFVTSVKPFSSSDKLQIVWSNHITDN